MGPKIALILLTLVSPLLLGVLMVGGPSVVWVGVPLLCALPLLLIVVGAGRSAPSSGSLLAIWILLCGSWFILFWLSAQVDLRQPTPDHAGLVLAVMLVGLGLAPLSLVAWIFARSFRDEGLAPEELARLSRREQS